MRIKKLATILLSSVLVISIVGCSSAKTANNNNDNSTSTTPSNTTKINKEPIKIVYPTTAVGKNPLAPFYADTVKSFNEKFKGKYELVLEEVPGEDAYGQKLKLLNATNDLPAIFDLGRDPSLAKIIIKSDRIVDLKPYIDASPEWKSGVIEESLKYNTVDGKVVATPEVSTQYIGMFYNKDLFQQVGIDHFPQTWDEFWAACEKLKAKGITPISLQTQGAGWTAELVHQGLIAARPNGLEFMKQEGQTDFNKDFFIEATKDLAKLFSYSTKDAIGGTYEMASNNFINGKTAMIANGPWMIPSFTDPKSAPAGFIDKVASALLPGNMAITFGGNVYGYAVPKNQPKEVQEGAIEFLKYFYSPDMQRNYMVALGGIAPHVELTDDQKKKLSKPDVELRNLVAHDMKVTIPVFQHSWDTAIQNEAIPKDLPALVFGKMTAEEYAKALTATAKKFAEQSSQASK